MPPLTKQQYQRLLERMTHVAQRETTLLLKALPKEFKARLADLPPVTFSFEERAPREKGDHRARHEPLSTTRRDTREIVLYVMAIFDLHGAEPGAFRQALQRLIVKELGDWAGIDTAHEE